jgi:hypothetical protein
VQLPLERLTTLGEHAHLAPDQLVELVTLEPPEVAVDDEAAPREAEEANEGPVPLDRHTFWQRVGNAVAHLRVVGGQQLRDTGHEPSVEPAQTPILPFVARRFARA